MFCSTIIPTVNRPTLSRAVYSVLQQDFPEDQYEIIVVNDWASLYLMQIGNNLPA